MPQSVFIYIVPDLASGQWRHSLHQLAEQAGWSLQELVKPISEDDLAANPKTIWISENPDLFAGITTVERFFTQQPAANIVDLLCRMAPGEDESHVAGRATYFLSQRDSFRKKGARPIQPGKAITLHPDLGPLKLEANPPSQMASYVGFFDPTNKQTDFEFPVESFRLGERRNNSDGMDFDLLGPSRSVLRGPYFYLPKGRWTVQLEFAIQNHTAPISFHASWPSAEHSELEFRVVEEGVYRIEMTGQSAGNEPCVLNISTTHSVLYGMITPMRLTLSRA